MRGVKFFFPILLIVLALAMFGCGKPKAPIVPEKPVAPEDNPNAIRVGIFLPLSGDKAAFGEATLEGAKLAVEECNAAGGVLGRPLALIVRDTRSEAAESAAAVRELAAKNVVAVIGEVTSENTLAAAPVAVELGLPMVSPGATHAGVTKAGPWVFRICYVDPFPGKVMSKFAISLGAIGAAVIFDAADPYSSELADTFVKDFTGQGGKIVTKETYAAGTTDFSAQLAAVKKGNPEVVFFPGYFAEAAAIIQQAKKLGVEAPFLGTDGWESEEFLKAGGADVNNSYFASHFSIGEKSDRTMRFVGAFEKMFGHPPIALAALGFDAVGFVADGIRRAGTTEAIGLRDAMAATSDFPAVTGNITLDAERNPAKSAPVLRVSDGKFNYLETVAP